MLLNCPPRRRVLGRRSPRARRRARVRLRAGVTGRSWRGLPARAGRLAAGRELVLDKAVVRELGELLDAEAGMVEHFDHRPCPKGPVLLEGEARRCPFSGSSAQVRPVVLAFITGRRGASPPALNGSPSADAFAAASRSAARRRSPSTKRTRVSSTGRRSPGALVHTGLVTS
jgi:hypothetical protein